MVAYVIVLVVLYLRVSPANSDYPTLKDIIKNKFDPDKNAFWTTEEIAHLSDDMNLFACFVEKKGSGDCQYYQPKFGKKCVGCEVEGSVVTFTSPGAQVVVTGDSITTLDGSTIPDVVTTTTMLQIVNAQNLVSIGSDLFEKFPNLESIIVFNTGITSALNITTPLEKLTNVAVVKNKVNRLNDYDFAQMPNLERLNLACNKISYVSDKAFDGLYSLTKISMGRNSLLYVPPALSSLKKTVQYIGLELNNITNLPSLPLKEMAELSHLNLTSNVISKIEPGWMDGIPNLRFLELGDNRMPKLESFSISNGGKLAYVDVSGNPDLIMVDGSAFKDLVALKALDIYGNNVLTKIDYRAFNNLPNIMYIDLSRNKLATFPHGVFIYANFKKLEKLWMQNNIINTVAEFTEKSFNEITGILETRFQDAYPLSVSFKQMVKLNHLDLSNNELTTIPNGVLDCFKNDQNSILDLSQNDIDTIEDDAFLDMTLKILYLNNNFLKEVPKALFKVKYLDTLRLNRNLLTYLEQGTLLNLNMTKMIYLENNQILAIEDDALPRSLESIDLSFNKFDFIDENQFNNMPELTDINFKSNRISYLPVNVFQNNVKLTNIILDENNIGWIDNGVFTTCSNTMSMLNMEKNSLAYVDHGSLVGKTIQQVLMSENDLHDWPQDGSFSYQTNPFYVDFRENKFEVIRSEMFKNHSNFQKADFENNHISDVEGNAFYNLDMDYKSKMDVIFGVNLKENPVSNLEPYSFSNIMSENKGGGKKNHAGLDLQSISTLYTLRSYTFDNVKMDYIFLNNGQVKLIETHAFNKIYLHWTLQFNDGPLKYIAKKAVNAEWIQYIQFNGNQIRKLPLGAFEEIASCTNFNIDNNQIDFIDTDSLPNCTEKFNFEHNNITHVVVDAFRKADSIGNLQFTDNKIIKIEAGALDTVRGKLKTLLLGSNPLPELPDNLLDTAYLTTLNLGDNKMLRTVGVQDLLSSAAKTVVTQDNRRAYIHSSLYKWVKKKVSGVLIYNVDECTCNLMESLANVDARSSSITRKGPANCDYTDIQNGNMQSLNVKLNSPEAVKDKLQCEPFTTRTVRESQSFQDQMPVSEMVTVYWRFPSTVVWGDTAAEYCCSGKSGGCINQVTVVMHCQKQAVDSDDSDDIIETDPFQMTLTTNDECDKEFSKSQNIDFSTTDFIFCSVKIEIPGMSSKFSALGPWRVGYQEELKTTEKISCTEQTLPFHVTYFDLTNDFVDFQNMGYDKMYENPKHYESPNIGPYLYRTDQYSSSDTVTQWFTPNPNIKNILQENFCLSPCSEFDADSYCMFARQWWPVDSLVDKPADTTGNFLRHNMYFTARLRMSAVFGGTEVLTIGGPDDIWVYMNGTLVLQVLAEEEDKATLPCGEITFSEGALVTKMGDLNMDKIPDYTTRCSNMVTVDNKADPAVFKPSNDMYIDIFTTQRRSLSSQIYLRMSSFNNGQWSNFATFSMSERKIRNGKIDQLDFKTVLGDQTYSVDIIDTDSSNDKFEVHDADFVWVEDTVAPVANVQPGAGVPEHYNCSEKVVPVTDVTPTHTSSITTSTALVSLENAIDYETIGENKFLYLYLKIRYEFEIEGETHELYNKIRVRVDVVDANDNCPVFVDEPMKLIDRTTLCLDLRGTLLNVTDADNGDNKAPQYFIGGYKVTNLDETEYEEYRTIDDYFTYEKKMVEFLIDVYVVDKGSPVRLGTLHRYQLTLSASCIQDMELIVGVETGLFNVKSPGWMTSSSNLAYCDTCTLGYRCPGYGSRILCSTCTQSFTNEELDKWMFDIEPREEEGCADRSKWEISFGGQATCSPCKPGWKCEGGVGTPVEQLERELGKEVGSHYINLCLDAEPDCVQDMKECEAGYLCRAGVTAKCPTGQYSTAGSSKCSFCPPGHFAPSNGSAECSCCDGGMESTHGKDSCDYCPENEISGECEMCRRCSSDVECPCLHDNRPCSQGVQCVNLPANSYKCLSCPNGFKDSDGSCIDIDECAEFSPCDTELSVKCTNTVPGFKCDSCPTGYTGNAPQGIGEPTEKQKCEDVNECDTNNGNCDINSECINMPGYHYCGYCFGQYVGNGNIPCKSGDYCENELHTCDSNAQCQVTGPAGYTCECNIMYAGNGTACGIDTDGDGYPDKALNCQGERCMSDNCGHAPNTDQADLDKDSLGDECDSDIDEDLAINEQDLCPYNANITSDMADNTDQDEDGWVNNCDNCKSKKNVDQYDKNFNGVGDECDVCENEVCFTDVLPACTDNSGRDSDGDGVDDNCDNCKYVANAAQRDTDGDKIGDSCDPDIDDDTLANADDNCPYLSNTDQANKDKDFKGDVCDDSSSWPDYMVNDADADGDGVPDVDDICPFDNNVSTFSFAKSELIDFTSLKKPSEVRWKVRSKGHDVDLEYLMYEDATNKLKNPISLLGETRFEELQYDGTFYIKQIERYPTLDTGTIGIIFGYQKLLMKGSTDRHITRFYLATWRHGYHTFNNCPKGKWDNCNYGATTGLQIKSVTIDSDSTWANRREALWWSASQTDASKKVTTNMVYQDPKHLTWDFNTAYRWRLYHHPSTGRMRMSIHTVTSVDEVDTVTTVVDTGDLFDKAVRGGRIGLYSFGQWNVTFANIAAKCLLPENFAANFNGAENVINLGDLTGLKISRSFEFSAWFMITEAPGTMSPILCKNRKTNTQTLCISISPDLKIRGDYAGFSVESVEEVLLNSWIYVVLRYDMQYKNIRLYHNIPGSTTYVQCPDFVNVGPVNEDVYAGWDGENYFKGQLDEIRILNRLIHEDDYLYTLLFKPSLRREQKMRLTAAHVNFDREAVVDVLGNVQLPALNSDVALLPKLVSSTILGQMYRFDNVNRGELEKKMYLADDGTSLRKRREIHRRNKRGKENSAPSVHLCTDSCTTDMHDEL